MRRFSLVLFPFFFLGLFGVPSLAGEFPEYLLKAQLLIRIAEFVDWPDGTFSSPKEPFIIAIVGKDPFGTYLETLARKEKIKDRPIILRRFAPDADPAPCHMLFVANAEQYHLERILSRISGSSVLIVGDTETMTKKGVHVGFLMIGGRIRFQINLRSAKACRLVIASQLLRLATKITDEEKP